MFRFDQPRGMWNHRRGEQSEKIKAQHWNGISIWTRVSVIESHEKESSDDVLKPMWNWDQDGKIRLLKTLKKWKSTANEVTGHCYLCSQE